MFAYATNHLVDIRAGVIVDVEPSPVNHAAEVSATQRMIDRVRQLFALTYDAGHSQYVCPAGKFLQLSWRMKKKNPYRYRASLHDCQACALKAQCCPGMDHR